MKIIVCLVCAVLCLSGCGDSRWDREVELDQHTFDSEAMQMIKSDSQLVLPDGTRGLNFRYRPPVDPAFIARLVIPEESVEQIRKQIEAIRNEEINISGGLAAKTSWWHPTDGAVIIDRQCHQPDNDYFRAVLTREGDRAILYIDHAVF
jgi:hypothetical protein